MNAAYIRNRMFEGSCWNLKVSPSWLGDCLIGGQHQSWRPTSRLAKPQDSSVEAAKHQPPNNKQSSKPSNTLRPAPPAFTNASSLHTVPEPSQTEFHLGSDPQSSDMDASELRSLLKQLHNFLATHNYSSSKELLSRAKLALLELDALVPTASTSTSHLLLARETLELGALISIRLQDPEAFTRYFQQLQPFYSLPSSQLPRDTANASKITGLYLLLLLSQGDYAGFHTLLEALEVAAAQAREQGQQEGDGGAKSGKGGLDEDAFIQYPIRLEQALMEGSYDRVWGETKSERVPSEEFGVFSEVGCTSNHSMQRPLATARHTHELVKRQY